MTKHKLAAYVQPVHDAYMNEYPPACNRRVEWLSGFSGSAGTAAVLAKKAALFVDGRYTLQARNEVKASLFEQHNSADVMPEIWLAEQLRAGARIGYDAKLFTRDMIMRMQAALEKKGVKLVAVPNLVDAIWKDRPPMPASPLFVHEKEYAGALPADKCKHIAKEIKGAGADAAVITAPDAVCWLLNIRGRDVENTPLVLATAIIENTGKVRLYVSLSRCNAGVRAHLGKNVVLCEPATLEKDLKAIGRKKSKVLCDPKSVPVWFTQVLAKAGAKIVEARDPCVPAKAQKNPVELEGMRNAHIRDGAAVVKLLCWLDSETSRRKVRETEISEKLLALRSAHPLFVEPSFTTIAGSGAHGAIVHYRVTWESDRALQQGELLLLDSGGQYPDGTTDITRTVPIGMPTQEHKDCFTRVLKGHIAVAMAKFPAGTSGSQLDALARQYLWQAGLDYDHGTGHGVGCFLGVHEGPQRISKRGGDPALMPGMIVSNEPGYYKAGEFGIRIESLVAVKEDGEKFLGFETISCVPIDTRIIEVALMTAAEKEWLNSYHAWVLDSLWNDLNETEQQWLGHRCKAI